MKRYAKDCIKIFAKQYNFYQQFVSRKDFYLDNINIKITNKQKPEKVNNV
jgi:hypothetical protein